jgi:hypothetical protein
LWSQPRVYRQNSYVDTTTGNDSKLRRDCKLTRIYRELRNNHGSDHQQIPTRLYESSHKSAE